MPAFTWQKKIKMKKKIVIKQSLPFSDIYLKKMSETSQKIEALIFASSKPVSENEIKKRLIFMRIFLKSCLI